MKSISLIVMVGAVLLAGSLSSVCQAPPQRTVPPQRAMPLPPPQTPPGGMPGAPTPAEDESKDKSNYTVRVEWKDSQGAAHHLEVLTTEGSFDLDTFLGKVKI